MAETKAEAFIENKGMSPSDFHDAIPRMAEVANERLVVPADINERLTAAADNLLLEPALLHELGAAVVAGNVVLQGPPGTGKSSLARALASSFNIDLYPVTAHEDWSTFEMIGRQELRINEDGMEDFVPVNGHFTEAAIRCAGNIPQNQDNPSEPQATWLLIDELNRAHPDKAFGELFSVLGTEDPVDITLSHQRVGNDILVVPRRFRIIATINSVDKQFVNSLSQGIRRRFTFLTVDIPGKKPDGEGWGSGSSLASREFKVAQGEAARRVAAALGKSAEDLDKYLADTNIQTNLIALFGILEKVRYADADSAFPFVPIGTAPVIDTLQLFLIRCAQDGVDANSAGAAMDWAASVKLVPLLEAGGVDSIRLAALAESLPPPFSAKMRGAMLSVASDGLYYTS